MPPLESTDMKGEVETPPSNPYKRQRQQQDHGTMADWTDALVQHCRSSFLGNPRGEIAAAVVSPSTKPVNMLSPLDLHRDPSVSSLSCNTSGGNDDHYGNIYPHHYPKSPPTTNVKRKKGPTVAIFVYVVALSVALLAYTEYQLWQLSETERVHNNILTGSTNKTRSERIGSSVGIISTMINVNETLMMKKQSLMKSNDDDDDDKERDDIVEEQKDTIIQIIHSRFMQNQPSLLHLGEARLHLFRHFFLRSLEEQSSKNFCCIIRTDPDLDPQLKQQIVNILQASNLTHILVASNETPKSQYQDFVQGNIQPSDVWSGSLEQIRQYLRLDYTTGDEIQPSRIIETRLDADDGLHRYFVETIQAEADDDYSFESESWRLWCVANHVEWQYQTIWNKTPSTSNDTGSIVALQVNYCVTPGLSIAFLGDDRSLESMPSTMNHEKLMHTRMCKAEKKISSNCRSFVPMTMGALRARTPTSAGMLNLVYNGSSMNRKYIRGATKQKDIQGKLWWAVRKFFGFSKIDATAINEYLNKHIKMIAEENLSGQCTKGHSCKNSSQILLKSIVEETSITQGAS
ncbi:putative rhamnosyl transferase [Nitzschia inconspicua]|uniref:Rhamnosyl transferase n=1 Tax=Nitzschia inconspicua TaxID=303405 RepID=A0A9K3KQP0_9STRA|nr:putative rhamnosyl transferase [Nitzschia inconspicua]